jgi:lysozyme
MQTRRFQAVVRCMKNISLLIAIGVAVYFLVIRKAGATMADSNGVDIGNPLYFSLGKIMAEPQTISQDGLNRLMLRESFSPTPYPDPPGSGKFSIGFGHQIQPGESFVSITRDQASELLAGDIVDVENAINENVSATLSQTQFDALCSFVYNVGTGAFKRGSIPEKLNAGLYNSALETMKLYVNANHAPNANLISRRSDEVNQFIS